MTAAVHASARRTGGRGQRRFISAPRYMRKRGVSGKQLLQSSRREFRGILRAREVVQEFPRRSLII